MPKIHRSLGLSINYPDNWTLSEDMQDQQIVGFQIQSPGSAYMSVLSFDWSTTPDQAIEQASSVIKAEYDNVEQESFAPELISHPGPLADAKGSELYFYYLDLLVRAKLIAFGIPHQTILIQFQAEDSEFASMERVFDAMLLTLCQSIMAQDQEDA
ncbi:MAG: hypothetical protein RLZZ396_296 [Planctomycetota bacterium]|jgi:hypothetical protein